MACNCGSNCKCGDQLTPFVMPANASNEALLQALGSLTDRSTLLLKEVLNKKCELDAAVAESQNKAANTAEIEARQVVLHKELTAAIAAAQATLKDAEVIVYGGGFSVSPEAGKAPISRGDGSIDAMWIPEYAGWLTELNRLCLQLFGETQMLTEQLSDDLSTQSDVFDQALNAESKRLQGVFNLAISELEYSLGKTIQALRSDHESLSEQHNNLNLQVKTIALAVSSQFQAFCMYLKEVGGDGVFRTKAGSAYDTRDYPVGMPFDNYYAPMNHHSHMDHPKVNGTAQFSFILGGRPFHMRHTDYQREMAANYPCDYGEVRVIDYPDEPVEVKNAATREEKIEWFAKCLRAREDESLRDEFEDWDSTHLVYVSFAETYCEELSDAELETFFNERHQLNANTPQEMIREIKFWRETGYQDPAQNFTFFPIECIGENEAGELKFGIWKARVIMAPVGTYAEWPLHKIMQPKKLRMLRSRKGVDKDALLKSRSQRFEIDPDILREWMAKIPGLDGAGAVINDSFSVRNVNYRIKDFKQQAYQNAAYYHDQYSISVADADGRSDIPNGFGDQTFVALNTRNEILPVEYDGQQKRVSFAMPFSATVIDPRQLSNIDNIPDVTATHNYGTYNPKATNYGKSEAKPFPGYFLDKGLMFYKTPYDVFEDRTNADLDPADTVATYRWVMCGDGVSRRQVASGVPPMLPVVKGMDYSMRQRWFFYEMHDEKTLGHRRAEFEAAEAAARDVSLQVAAIQRDWQSRDVELQLKVERVRRQVSDTSAALRQEQLWRQNAAEHATGLAVAVRASLV